MKNNSTYKYIIYALIFFIIILIVILLVGNNKQETNPTPTPIPSIPTLSLYGDDQITLIEGTEYEEPGYNAFDINDGNLNSKVVIEGHVDTSIPDSYTLIYSVTNSAGKKVEKTRIIDILKDVSIEIDYSPKEATNNDVTITLTITGDCFDHIEDPNGNIIKDKKMDYSVSSNDEYLFKINKIDGTIIEKTIKIENIDKVKPTGSCKNTVTNEKTIIDVNAKDDNGINKYEYNYNNKKMELTTNSYTVNEKIYNASVTIYDKAGNYETINCQKKDDTWPVITNPNYTNHPIKNYSVSRKYAKRMNYIIYFPNHVNTNEKNALVVYLHGYGEFGTNIKNTMSGSSEFTNNMLSGRFQEKAIFLAPQCYAGHGLWGACFDDLTGLINEIVKEFNVDTNRITMTGHSLGGKAVFDYITLHPGLLAAAAPLAPSVINKSIDKLKGIKIAVFTGTKDGLYGKNKTDTDYLIKNGVNLKFYPLQNVTHSSQKAMYSGTNVIEWLVSQSKE